MSDEFEDDEDERAAEAWDEEKSALMEQLLGKEHDMVMHAIIPYAVGGGLDLYYYPHGIPGTAVATKELSVTPDAEDRSSNNWFECYELVMFTRQALNLDEADSDTPFGRAHQNINAVLNVFAPYSAQATLNPHETCEFPEEMERVGGKCFILDDYGGEETDDVLPFGLLAVIEVYRSEMDYARKNGGAKLLAKLKKAGHYPYSDLERDPVA